MLARDDEVKGRRYIIKDENAVYVAYIVEDNGRLDFGILGSTSPNGDQAISIVYRNHNSRKKELKRTKYYTSLPFSRPHIFAEIPKRDLEFLIGGKDAKECFEAASKGFIEH